MTWLPNCDRGEEGVDGEDNLRVTEPQIPKLTERGAGVEQTRRRPLNVAFGCVVVGVSFYRKRRGRDGDDVGKSVGTRAQR